METSLILWTIHNTHMLQPQWSWSSSNWIHRSAICQMQLQRKTSCVLLRIHSFNDLWTRAMNDWLLKRLKLRKVPVWSMRLPQTPTSRKEPQIAKTTMNPSAVSSKELSIRAHSCTTGRIRTRRRVYRVASTKVFPGRNPEERISFRCILISNIEAQNVTQIVEFQNRNKLWTIPLQATITVNRSTILRSTQRWSIRSERRGQSQSALRDLSFRWTRLVLQLDLIRARIRSSSLLRLTSKRKVWFWIWYPTWPRRTEIETKISLRACKEHQGTILRIQKSSQ